MEPFIYTLDYVKEQAKQKKFKVISTFAGGGGSSTGYRLAGADILAINEFIPEAQRVYKVNYPDTHIFPGDVRQLTGEMMLQQVGLKKGELDLFDGSPPCSSFSMSGLREEGWGRVKKYSDSEQRTDDLFFEYARLLKEIQPKTFVAENVKGLTAGAAGDLLGTGQCSVFGDEDNTIYHTLTNAGYNVKYKVLNASHYGVPQARERIIFIGVRKDIGIEPTFPKRMAGVVTAGQALEGVIVDNPPSGRTSTKAKLLYDNTEIGYGFDVACKKLFGKASWFNFIKLHPDKPSNTVTTIPVLFHWKEFRTLSILEVKRLCSFPDDYYVGEKYNKQYERLGRAVPPLMMKAIAEHIYETILKKIPL